MADTEKAPLWMEKIVRVAAENVKPQSVMGPLGWKWVCPGEEKNPWEISIYPTPSEIYAGPLDGVRVKPGYKWDLNRLFGIFDDTPRVIWSSPSERQDAFLGSEIDVCGEIGKVPVWLRLFNTPPHNEKPTLIIDPKNGRAKEIGKDDKPKKKSKNSFRPDDVD